MSNEQNETLSCMATLGGVSFSGKGAAKIGVSMARADVSLETADMFFSDTELRAVFTIGENTDDLPGVTVETLVLDCVSKTYSVKPEHYTVSLSVVGEIASLAAFVGFGGHDVMAQFTLEA